MIIKIEPQKTTSIAILITIGLILANMVGLIAKHLLGFSGAVEVIKMFDLDHEKNLPTFFSSLLMMFCAGLLYLIAMVQKDHNRRFARWNLLAAIMTFLAVDEFCAIHEQLIKPLRAALHTSGIFYYAWIIPYGALLLILILLYIPFFRSLPSKTRRLFFASGLMYVLGAIGFEALGGIYLAHNAETKDLGFGILYTIEESLEMFGTVIFQYALMSYVAVELEAPSVQIVAREGSTGATGQPLRVQNGTHNPSGFDVQHLIRKPSRAAMMRTL